MTRQDIIAKFQAFLLTEQCVSHNTFKSYSVDLEQFAVFLDEQSVELNALSREIVQKFLYYLYSMKLSTASVARKVSTLKALFSYMHRRLGFPDLSIHLLIPKAAQKLPRYLTLQEIEKLFEAAARDCSAHRHRNNMIVMLLYASGMRISELIMLKKTDLDPSLFAIRVNGKGGKQRVIPLPQAIFVALEQYTTTVHRAWCERNQATTDYLFPVAYGKKVNHISRQTCWHLLNKLWRSTGSDKTISPHQLRHSLATHMLATGINLRSLQLILGHESLVTVQLYTHVEKSFLRSVYDKKHPRS